MAMGAMPAALSFSQAARNAGQVRGRGADARLLVEVPPEEEAYVVVGVGHAVLPAVERHEVDRGRAELAPDALREERADILQQAQLHELAHPRASEPEHHIGRRARQPVADRFLVALVIEDVEPNLDVGVGGLEAIDGPLPRGARRRIRRIGVDHQARGCAPVRGGREQDCGNRRHHDFQGAKSPMIAQSMGSTGRGHGTMGNPTTIYSSICGGSGVRLVGIGHRRLVSISVDEIC